jgi:hypothetical protein
MGPSFSLTCTRSPKNGSKMQPQADTVPLDPAGATLAFGDDLVFFEEFLGPLAEGLFALLEEAGAAPSGYEPDEHLIASSGPTPLTCPPPCSGVFEAAAKPLWIACQTLRKRRRPR